VVGVLEHLFPTSADGFSGILSALYAGDKLLAAHFGLRCHGILHWWFPAFRPAYAKYSAGWVLLHEVLTNLAELGCHTLDFGPGGGPPGPGSEEYKRYFADAQLPFTAGCVELPSVVGFARKWRRRVVTTVRSTDWLYRALRPVVRMLRHLRARPAV
jgi:CelD/BcsL family acetyltransferase involved in cellulose biosynthesis